MRVGQARAAAAQWVMRHARREAGFRGAYFSGSTIELPDDAELPAASDVDVVVVTAAAEAPLKLGKFVYLETLVEVTSLPWRQLASFTPALSTDDLLRRAGDVIQFLPRLWETTDAILSANPGISPQ